MDCLLRFIFWLVLPANTLAPISAQASQSHPKPFGNSSGSHFSPIPVSLVFTGIAVIAAKKSFELAGELATYRYFIKRASLSCKGCPFPLMLHGSIFLFPILLSVSANVSKAECFILFYLSLDGGPQIPIIKLESF